MHPSTNASGGPRAAAVSAADTSSRFYARRAMTQELGPRVRADARTELLPLGSIVSDTAQAVDKRPKMGGNGPGLWMRKIRRCWH